MAGLTRSYVHGASDVPLIGETIGALFRRVPWRAGPIAMRWSCASRTSAGPIASCSERVDAFAAGLLALGLEPGDRIGIWSPNNAEWVLTQFATAKAGLILVNINPAYRLAELEYALNKVGCKALITATALQDQRLSRHARRAGAGAAPAPAGRSCSAAQAAGRCAR